MECGKAVNLSAIFVTKIVVFIIKKSIANPMQTR